MQRQFVISGFGRGVPSRRALVLATALLAPAACSEVEVPEGVFPCATNLQCPASWTCETREDVAPRCWRPTLDAGVLEDSSTPEHTGPPNPNASKVDAGSFACGSWKRVSHTSPAPDDAVAYGRQATKLELGKNYVCRYRYLEGDRQIVLQGRAVVNYGCLAVTLRTPTKNPAPRTEANYDVLVGTKTCVGQGTLSDVFFGLPTGVDADGSPTYSCVAQVASDEIPGVTNAMVGRLDPLFNQCLFVSEDGFVEASSSYQTLLGPGTSPMVLDEVR